ncbi:hypothetical protein B0F90DRAFT_1680128 [Multifurca ochricompacta]|uniref:Secreted protein n=1 Tax=Multifurca ochricompacta TaxID=376703 RepID=A0AAD4QQL9_9AGAM|nr:hypothetical protein B0F90DRAFT_1680128 [Multifurca ochricompacta]
MFGGRRSATLLLLSVLEPDTPTPPHCARDSHSHFAVVLNHFIYLRKAPYIPPLSSYCPRPHVLLLSSYPPLLSVP